MLGISSRSWRSRCQGSSCRKRMDVSKRGATPHLQAEEPGQPVRDRFSHPQNIDGPNARGQQRLVCIAKCRVGDQQSLLFAGPLRELPGPSSICRVPSAPAMLPLERNRRQCRWLNLNDSGCFAAGRRRWPCAPPNRILQATSCRPLRGFR